MSKKLEGIHNFHELFNDTIFRIPDYQRGYAWKTEQLKDFWEDVTNLAEGKSHYTGMIALQPFTTEDEDKLLEDKWIFQSNLFNGYYIVDGQQRFTTTIIFLHELISKIKQVSKECDESNIIINNIENVSEAIKRYLYRVSRDGIEIKTYLFGYDDNNVFKFWKREILEDLSITQADETYYTRNLQNAKRFFRQEIDTYCNTLPKEGVKDALVRLYERITTCLKYNVYIVSDDYDVFVTFETMNNRGKKLSNLELFKNRLIYLTTLFPDSELNQAGKVKLRKEIDETWKEIYRQLGRDKDVPLNDDDFLKAHWIMYYRYSRKRGDDYIKDLFEIFSQKKLLSTVSSSQIEDVDEVTLDGAETIETENDENDISKGAIPDTNTLTPLSIQKYLESLRTTAVFWYSTYFPNDSSNPVNLTKEQVEWIDKLNKMKMSFFRNLIFSLLASKVNSEKLLETLKKIERLNFICYKMGHSPESKFNAEYYNYSRRIYNNYIKHSVDKDECMDVDILIQNIDKDIAENMQISIEDFIAWITKKFTKKIGDVGYYNWDALNYFMFEYEQYLNKKNGSQFEYLMWKDFNVKQIENKVTKEHILPRVSNDDYWKQHFSGYDDRALRVLKGALGNLLPLSQSRNSKVSNLGYDKKKVTPPDKAYSGYCDGCYSEREVANNYEEWDENSIYERSKKLLEFMQIRWGFVLDNKQMESLIFIRSATNE